ncbi:CgeB family protein [Telluribacter humicola]|uniref:CgeB family protein n=1 Tax=Telluribacter humicola TaxID=1720261 RepID=UPI001A95F18E|nr:glycosyltransferase [Telluribacter humicola]
MKSWNITILGLSITSSWGNGHATTFRALIKQLQQQGHRVHFLERDVPWYASNSDMPAPPYCKLDLYSTLEELKRNYESVVAEADMVIVGSYVPEGVEVGKWVQQSAQGIKAFYDIDTPVTLAKLKREDYEYLHPYLIPGYDLYLSFTGGPTLDRLEEVFSSPSAKPLYCSFDTDLYYPEDTPVLYDLGYLGTYSPDRQPSLEKLMIDAAQAWPEGRFAVVGPQYPETIQWPANVAHTHHLPPSKHRQFYNTQRFTMNITRADMIQAGYSPSVRLFEAAACGVPIISDYWDGLDTVFSFDEEILVSYEAADTLRYLKEMDEHTRKEIGEKSRQRVLKEHTSVQRAKQLIGYAEELKAKKEITTING